jgi:hypothetical protein
VLLVDLAAAAGAFAGVVGATITKCVSERSPGGGEPCSFAPSQRNARFALVGGATGLVAGWLLTRNLDKGENPPSERHALRLMPLPTGDRRGEHRRVHHGGARPGGAGALLGQLEPQLAQLALEALHLGEDLGRRRAAGEVRAATARAGSRAPSASGVSSGAMAGQIGAGHVAQRDALALGVADQRAHDLVGAAEGDAAADQVLGQVGGAQRGVVRGRLHALDVELQAQDQARQHGQAARAVSTAS